MPNFYPYLISSLPMLHFGTKPPFLFERFLEMCRDSIPEEDLNILKILNNEKLFFNANFRESNANDREWSQQDNSRESALDLRLFAFKKVFLVLQKWFNFDRSLRNELVKIRAARKHVDPTKYIRGDEYSEQFIVHTAMSAHRTPSILEAEKVLDQARWNFLDELSLGHFFDLDFLIIYALKLLILQRWERINSAEKERALEEILLGK